MGKPAQQIVRPELGERLKLSTLLASPTELLQTGRGVEDFEAIH
jgi:hypothetical protein